MTDAAWAPVLPARERAAVLDRLAASARPHRVPHSVRPDLAGGGAGLALAYHWLDRALPGRGYGALAEGYLAAALRGYARLGASPGLFGGAAGLAFAVWSLSHDEAALHRHVVDEVTARARRAADGPYSSRAVDVVAGLTGAGAYLLCRRDDPAAAEALRTVLTALTRTRFPDRPDPGMAHGTAGPLALLALALAAEATVPGQREAAVRLAAALAAGRADDAWGPDWPAPATGRPLRASWCRGGPGIARALWLAGTALDDAELRGLAVRALRAALRRPPERRRVDGDPGLCHGVTGLLHITSRFAHDTGDPGLTTAAARLAAGPLPSGGGPGFLDGAAGVTLALLGAATDAAPGWDRALLLA
ncbi:lanthionine synthetase LanC family protein [Streptomyces sp. CA-181903]|uniref:lanthionine synthetase LanC family protein n=1 Tax=Streptomyces sp. CA-181903 TaxID=3240055 RepID=UPI003D92159B